MLPPKFKSVNLNRVEQAMLDHLQQFLLELGRGFCFEARQKRFSLGGQDFFIDLVFYNYILKCFVLIDIKTGELTHQDIGQIQMYVNYYTRELMNEGDHKPIGIVLCAEKNDAVVKYTLPEDNDQIYASKYLTYLPTEWEHVENNDFAFAEEVWFRNHQSATDWRRADIIVYINGLAIADIELKKASVYVLIHELVHLLEPTHNERFSMLMTRYCPNWRSLKDHLNGQALEPFERKHA